jgi:predicted methyltransferase
MIAPNQQELNVRRIIIATTLGLICLSSGFVSADVEEKLKAAMESDSRSAAEVARDKNRKPVETLKFFGLTENMKVLELLPGGGWYTKLLAPVLADDGELIVAIGTQGIERMQENGQFPSVKIADLEMSAFDRPEGSRRFAIAEMDLNVKNVDLVLTFRNLHNINAETRALLNKEIFRATKSGGHYGVIDHTRRHMQADNSENWRRMDPVLMIKEIEAAGFEFVDMSDLHYRYDDELVYEVGRRSVSGNTDRFTLLFKKP